MATPGATRATVPPELTPALLDPLVAVVAILGELAATAGDVPLTRPPGSLRAGLVALTATINRAMGHRHGEATRLRHALAAAATAEATWATVAAAARKWREAVASAETAWTTVTGDAGDLRDACEAAATAAGATAAGATANELVAAVAQQDRARQELLAATRALPVASELAAVTSELTAHGTLVAKASAEFQAATEATEATAVAVVATAVTGERGRRAAVAREPLGRLVAACRGAASFYCHLRRRLEDIEVTVAATAAGRGGPEVARGDPGVPEATAATRPGVPEALLAAVTAAEALWDASARLAQGHLLGTLRVTRGLLATPGVPDATVVAAVARRCREATAALPGLLPRGPP